MIEFGVVVGSAFAPFWMSLWAKVKPMLLAADKKDKS
jgi:hypothetical protein